MEMGLAAATAPGGKEEDKDRTTRRRVGQADSGTRKLVHLVAKLALSSALQVRLLRAIIIDCWRMPSADPAIQRGFSATKAFAKAAETVPREQKLAKLGLPHLQLWNAFLQVVKETLTAAPQREALLKYIAEWGPRVKDNAQGFREMAKEVRHFRLVTHYDKKTTRVEAQISPASMSHVVYTDIIVPYMKNQGGEEMEGIAPRGDLERRIQEALDEAAGEGV